MTRGWRLRPTQASQKRALGSEVGYGSGAGVGSSEVSWGSATSVLGDFAVVFGVDVPAQTDGQQHPQELWGGQPRVRGAAVSAGGGVCEGRARGVCLETVEPLKPYEEPQPLSTPPLMLWGWTTRGTQG